MVFERFCDFIADIFQVEKDTLTKKNSFSEDLEAEEEDLQELLMIIEEEFDISLTMEEISEIDTIGELSDRIENQLFGE